MRILATCIATASILWLFACAGPEPAVPKPTPPDHAGPLDTPPPPPDTPPGVNLAANVTLANGFQIAGRLRGIAADGLVQFTAPLFVGEQAVRLNMVNRIQLGVPLPSVGRDMLTLATGELLWGRVEAITDDAVAFRSSSLGTVNLPKSALASVRRWPGGPTLLSTDFAAGRIAPWTRSTPRRDVLKGADIATTRGGHFIRAAVEHNGDVTIVVELLRARKIEGDFLMRFFMAAELRDGARVPAPSREAILVQLTAREIVFRTVGGSRLGRAKLPRLPHVGGAAVRMRLRIGYIAESKTISAWLNGKLLHEVTVEKPPPAGAFIGITKMPGWGMARISVMDGVAAPKDVVFGSVKRTARPAGHVTVDMNDGSLTMNSVQMTATHLQGTSPLLGAIRIRRGAIHTLRAGGRVAKTTGPDVVTLADGRSLSCRVLSVDARRRPHFQVSWLDGEGVLSAGLLKALRLPVPALGKPCLDRVTLTNGDVLAGKMLELTGQELDFRSGVFGDLTLPTGAVATISHRAAMVKPVVSVTDFSTGRMGPWKPYIGKWSLKKGWLRGQRPPPKKVPKKRPPQGLMNKILYATLAAEVDQSQGVTIEVEVDVSMLEDFAAYHVILCADALERQWGNEYIIVSLKAAHLRVVHCTKDIKQVVMEEEHLKGFGRRKKGASGVFRVAYVPQTGVLAAWFNGEEIGRCKIDQPPEAGRYVMLSQYGRRPCFRRAQILQRFVPPGMVPAPDVFRMLLGNGDTVDARSVTMAEGVITVMTADGEMRLPLARLAWFAFPTRPRKAPPSSSHDAVIKTEHGPLSLKFTALTPEHLIGHSALLGPIKLPRKLVHSLEFPPRAAASVSLQ